MDLLLCMWFVWGDGVALEQTRAGGRLPGLLGSLCRAAAAGRLPTGKSQTE